MKKRALVTGCAGFIGSHLTELLLDKGFEVIGMDNFDAFYDKTIKEKNLAAFIANHNFHFIEADIRNENTWKNLNEKVDVAFHLAAKAGVLPSLKNPVDYISTNISGTQLLLDWMKLHEVKKLIFASSSSVYGNQTKIPFSETDIIDKPISPYASTKKSGELITYTYHHLYQLDVVNLRFFTVFGERQRPDLAIHKFIHKILKNEPIEIYGDGTTARDYTYIKDIVGGIFSSYEYIENKTGVYEIINLGNNNPVKLIDLINTLYEITNRTPNLIYKPMQPGDVNITFADISKAKFLLNYEPKTTFKQGLQNFLSWHLNQK